MNRTTVFALVLAGVYCAGVLSQAEPGDEPARSRGEPKRGEGAGPRPPKPILEKALDTNDDGEISADEIDNAPAALKKLDKNGDGKLSAGEFRPRRPRPEMGPGAGSSEGRRRPRDGDRRGPPRDGDKPDERRPPPPDQDPGPPRQAVPDAE